MRGRTTVPFCGVEFAGEDLHKRRFAGAVGAGEAVAAAGDEADADIFKEDLRAVAHGDVADAEHGWSGSYSVICGPQPGIGIGPGKAGVVLVGAQRTLRVLGGAGGLGSSSFS